MDNERRSPARPSCEKASLGRDQLVTPKALAPQLGEETKNPKDQTLGNREASKRVSLFIGGMNSLTDLSALQKHLRALAGASSGLFVSMVSRTKRKTFSGYGVIKNVDPIAAEQLLAVKNFQFQDCWYGIKPFFKKKSEISKLRSERAKKKVYLSGITTALVEIDLGVYFSKYGDVLHVQISKNPGTNEYKGFGFVEFDAVHSAETVLSTLDHIIKGVTVVCGQSDFAKKSKEPGARSLSSSQGPTGSNFPEGKKASDLDLPGCSVLNNANSHAADLIKMSPKVAGNHAFSNVAFRIRLNF